MATLKQRIALIERQRLEAERANPKTGKPIDPAEAASQYHEFMSAAPERDEPSMFDGLDAVEAARVYMQFIAGK